jgi:hypothetical protein
MSILKASILKDSNRAVSTSEDSWESVRQNNYVKFGTDETFYIVGSTKKLFYIKDFSTNPDGSLSIHDNVGINLGEHDCLSLSFKEYQLLTVITPINKGLGYKIGDKVLPYGGSPSTDTTTGLAKFSSLIVSQVDEKGGIIQLRLNDKGRYIVAPDAKVSLTGGNGKGAIIQAQFVVIDDRALVERTVLKIDRQNQTVIVLDAPLPNGVLEGKLSVEKWEMLLTSNYVGESKMNETYAVSRDTTPNLNIPLVLRGGFAPESVYNLALAILDQEIGILRAEIEKLKKQANR